MRGATVAGVLLTMLGGACGDTAPEGAQPDVEEAPVSESAVSVRLEDFVVEPTPDSVPAGRVTFEIQNDGYAMDEEGDDVASPSGGKHEFSVLRTDLPGGDLPQNTTTFLAEVDAPGIEVVGSAPVLEDGQTESLSVDLQPGPYVLICNLTSHYARGMWAEFSVSS